MRSSGRSVRPSFGVSVLMHWRVLSPAARFERLSARSRRQTRHRLSFQADLAASIQRHRSDDRRSGLCTMAVQIACGGSGHLGYEPLRESTYVARGLESFSTVSSERRPNRTVEFANGEFGAQQAPRPPETLLSNELAKTDWPLVARKRGCFGPSRA